MAQPFDLAEELAKQPHLLEIPGNLLMKGGPEDYIGAVLCVRGTLYFREAHTPLVREALCQCFDEFKQVADAIVHLEPYDEYQRAKTAEEIDAGIV